MNKAIARFDWDDGNWQKCQKHGVPIDAIEALFHGQPGVYADPEHSIVEQRLRAIGRTAAGRTLIVAFTIREVGESTLIRPISARYMHQREIERYEQAQTEKTSRPEN